MKPLHEWSVAEAGALLRSGTLTSTILTEYALSRIAAIDDRLHAFIVVTAARARDDAARADRELGVGIDRGPMHGIPYALKDIFATAGIATTCHSRLLIEHVPSADSAVEEKLRAGGAVLLGKLATHEFAIGGPSFDLPFPPARNPWNVDHFTGGSSSGSAAAVAAGFVRVAAGSDTTGSIRGPACYCGTIGLKPTYGRVSRRGAFPLSYSLDHCGLLSWAVEDAALALQVIAGYDPLDLSSADVPVPDFTATIGQDLAGLRIACPRHFFAKLPDVSPEVLSAIDDAAETLGRLGATIDEVRLPDFELFSACGRVILAAEAYAIHEHDLQTRPLDYGRYTFQRIVLGAGLTAADITQAFRLRQELAAAVNGTIFKRYDGLITATGLGPAPRLDEFPEDWPTRTPMQAVPFNVTGNPAMAIPTGLSTTGMPLGMQIVGRAFDEPTLFRIGAAFQAATSLVERRPDSPERHST